MILLEFAAQGVRGVAPAGGRATLRPGYNVIAADGAALRRLLEALLYPDPHDVDAIPRAPGGPPGGALRAGLTLVGDDRVTYRLVRDFAGGAQLHRFDAARRSFALVSQDLAEIGAFLQETVGVPPAARAEALLALSGPELPSRQAGPAGAAPARPALSPEQARRRLAQLEAELVRARAIEKLQHELDALQSQAFAADEALKSGEALKEGLARAQAARDELEPVAQAAAALGDAEARLAAYERASARRDEAAARVEAERAALAEAEARGAPDPFWRAPPFWAGIATGALLALAGAAGGSQGMRTLALLDIPAFGWSAWLALRWISEQEAWERVARRRRVVDDWEQKIEAQYQRDAGELRAALQALGLAGPADLRDALGRLADAEAVLAEWRGRLAAWAASPQARDASAEKARLAEAHRELEERLAAETGGGFVRDPRTVEQEMQRLEAEAAAPAAAPVRAGPPVDPLVAVLERAAPELGGSPAAAALALAPRASQVLSGLSFQRLGPLQPDDRGRLQVSAAGRLAAAAQLPPADRDLVFLSVKLALLERALAGGRRVAVVDGAFDGLSEGARRFAARLLKQIARPGQIVHATSDASFREAADHAA